MQYGLILAPLPGVESFLLLNRDAPAFAQHGKRCVRVRGKDDMVIDMPCSASLDEFDTIRMRCYADDIRIKVQILRW